MTHAGRSVGETNLAVNVNIEIKLLNMSNERQAWAPISTDGRKFKNPYGWYQGLSHNSTEKCLDLLISCPVFNWVQILVIWSFYQDTLHNSIIIDFSRKALEKKNLIHKKYKK